MSTVPGKDRGIGEELIYLVCVGNYHELEEDCWWNVLSNRVWGIDLSLELQKLRERINHNGRPSGLVTIDLVAILAAASSLEDRVIARVTS